MGLTLRPYNQGDLDYLRVIDLQGYENPWDETEIRRHGHNIVVAVSGFRPHGFAAVETLNQRAMMLRLVVEREYRRQGIGSRLLAFLQLEYGACTRMTTLVPETNLPAQLFLNRHGWRCVNVMKKHFDICGRAEDGYYFVKLLR